MAVTVQTTTLDIDNSTSETIEDYVFTDITGQGIRIGVNVVSLTIKNCAFFNISEDAIYLRVSGNSTNVIIENCTFQNIGRNCVLTGENHTGLIIRNNVADNIALDPDETAPLGSPHHGIYVQCPNSTIENNIINRVINVNGNGISIRSSGTVTGNTISNVTKYGISYFSDHAGAGGDLVITDNRTYIDNQRGINLASDGTPANHVDSISVTGNYIFNTVRSSIGVDVALDSITTTNTNRVMFNNVFDESLEPNDILTSIRTELENIIGGIVKGDENFFTWEPYAVNSKWDNFNLVLDQKIEELGSSDDALKEALPYCLIYNDGEVGVSPTTDTGRNGGIQTNDVNYKIQFFPYVDEESEDELYPPDHIQEISKCVRDLKKAFLSNRTLNGLVCNTFWNGYETYLNDQNTLCRYTGVIDITVRYRQWSYDIDRRA